MLKKILILGCVTLFSACATPPATYDVSATRTFQKPYDLVWEEIVQFMASRNIQIKNIAKDSGIIYAESARFDDSVADCGKPGILHVVGRLATFNVFVNRSTGSNIVSINTTFTEMRNFDGPIQNVTCNSTGKLESAILNAVKTI